MIDTIKFQIDINKQVYDKIRAISIELNQKDNELNHEIVRILTKRFKIGSYDRHINLKLYDEETCYLEFSVPKVFYGHNVYMVAPEQVLPICESVHKAISSLIKNFPCVNWWKIKRLDLCYAWKLPSDYIAEQMINIFRGVAVNRKKSHFYDTSVMWYGRTQAIKFYMKHPEFYEHDFKELKKKGLTDIAYNFLGISEGVLRFEVTLRGIALAREFTPSYNVPYITFSDDVFTEKIILKSLNKYLYKIFRLNSVKTMDNKTVFDKLEAYFGTIQARHIYTFYKILFSPDSNEKLILNSYTRMQVYRYLKKLKSAGIGISSDQIQIGFDFSIPSDYAVNFPRPSA